MSAAACPSTASESASQLFLHLRGMSELYRIFWFTLHRFFPTCQVRVVRFYHSCSSPPPPPPPPPRLAILLLLFLLLVLLLLLLRLFLLDHVCINFRLANSWPSSLPTSQLSVHRWTSTWDLPSSVCTAGAQCAPLDLNSGTFRAQCAPLDLNLGPSQLSVHRWTSTAR